jgi:hypothetical protein
VPLGGKKSQLYEQAYSMNSPSAPVHINYINQQNLYQTNNNFFSQEAENQKNEECKQIKSVATSIMAAGAMTDIENLNKKSGFKQIHKPLPQRYQTLNVITGRGGGMRS